MSPFDHAVRAANLAILSQDAYKLNEECLDAPDQPIEVDENDQPVVVPYRYAGLTYDGRGSWMLFSDDLADLSTQMLGSIQEDYPWAPGPVMDLDLGEVWEPVLKLDLVPAKMLARAGKVLARLNAGGLPSDALRAEGFDPEDSAVMTEEHAGGDFDDPQNTVLDFCANVLLRRVAALHVKTTGEYRNCVWELETY